MLHDYYLTNYHRKQRSQRAHFSLKGNCGHLCPKLIAFDNSHYSEFRKVLHDLTLRNRIDCIYGDKFNNRNI